MLIGDTGDFVRGLRDLRELEVSSLVFETIESPSLREAHADLDQLIRRLTAAKVAIVGVLDQRGPTPQQSPPSPVPGSDDEPAAAASAPPPPPDDKAAQRDARIARSLADLPHTKAAFERGALTLEQVNALVRLSSEAALRDALRGDELGLVDAIATAGPDRTGDIIRDWRSRQGREQVRRDAKARHRQRSVRTWRDDDGFSHLHFKAADAQGAETLANFRALLDADWTRKTSAPGEAPIDERTREQRAADVLTGALATAVSAMADGKARPRPRTTMLVRVDHDDLVARLGGTDLATDGLVNGSDIAQMCCDAGIARIVTKGDSVVLDKGRETRLADRHQRQALATMFDGCAEPGCRCPFWATEVHHLDEFVAEMGETNLADLVPLCPVSHRRCHHDGHVIERTGTPGDLVWVTPDGARYPITHRSALRAPTGTGDELGFAV